MWDVSMPEPRLCDIRAESIACGSRQYLIETDPGHSCQYVPEACWSFSKTFWKIHLGARGGSILARLTIDLQIDDCVGSQYRV